MLVPFRGCCSLRMYLPNKPAKYRLKIQVLTDCHHYMLNAEVYTRKLMQRKGRENEWAIWQRVSFLVLLQVKTQVLRDIHIA